MINPTGKFSGLISRLLPSVVLLEVCLVFHDFLSARQQCYCFPPNLALETEKAFKTKPHNALLILVKCELGKRQVYCENNLV